MAKSKKVAVKAKSKAKAAAPKMGVAKKTMKALKKSR